MDCDLVIVGSKSCCVIGDCVIVGNKSFCVIGECVLAKAAAATSVESNEFGIGGMTESGLTCATASSNDF